MPPEYDDQECQGKSKQERGDPLDNDVTRVMGSRLLLLLTSSRVIDMSAGHCKDGMTYLHGDGTSSTIREVPFKASDHFSNGYTTYLFERKGGHGRLTLHRLLRSGLESYGACVNNPIHYEVGGVFNDLLDTEVGPFKSAESFEEKFKPT